jgi:methionine-rich copper-binding protein CopC
MKLIRLGSVLALLALSCGAALAHAIVLNSTPAPDQTLFGEEISIEIRFNSWIDVARSHLKLYKPDGGAIALRATGSAATDILKATASGLLPGAYRLHWQTLSPDGHISQGDIRFNVSR